MRSKYVQVYNSFRKSENDSAYTERRHGSSDSCSTKPCPVRNNARFDTTTIRIGRTRTRNPDVRPTVVVETDCVSL